MAWRSTRLLSKVPRNLISTQFGAARLRLHDVSCPQRRQRAQDVIEHQIRDEERRAEVVPQHGVNKREETHAVLCLTCVDALRRRARLASSCLSKNALNSLRIYLAASACDFRINGCCADAALRFRRRPNPLATLGGLLPRLPERQDSLRTHKRTTEAAATLRLRVVAVARGREATHQSN